MFIYADLASMLERSLWPKYSSTNFNMAWRNNPLFGGYIVSVVIKQGGGVVLINDDLRRSSTSQIITGK